MSDTSVVPNGDVDFREAKINQRMQDFAALRQAGKPIEKSEFADDYHPMGAMRGVSREALQRLDAKEVADAKTQAAARANMPLPFKTDAEKPKVRQH